MFEEEIKYCIIGIPLGFVLLILNPGASFLVWLYTWLLCRSYHKRIMTALIKYGPEKVLGVNCKGSWNYAVYCDWLRKELKRVDEEIKKNKEHENEVQKIEEGEQAPSTEKKEIK